MAAGSVSGVVVLLCICLVIDSIAHLNHTVGIKHHCQTQLYYAKKSQFIDKMETN